MTFETTQRFALALCVGRVLIGLAPFVAAGPAARMLGFPAAHDTPTTRLFARMFGVRDAALAVLVWHALPDLAQLRWTFLFNAAMDAGDALSCVIPIAGRRGITRAAVMSLGFALVGGSLWMVVYALSG